MEISKFTKYRKFSFGLLIFLTVFINLGFSEKISRRQLKNLTLQISEGAAYVDQDCLFILNLPGIAPENVNFTTPNSTSYATFSSSRRMNFIDADRDIGTQIEFYFKFTESGKFTLPPITIEVRGYRYSIPFPEVEIVDNPETALPKMRIKFDSGVSESNGKLFVTAGKPVKFTVFVKFILQISKLDWSLQKNSLFSEIQRYEITKGQPRKREAFSEEVPVATFEWIPLNAGEFSLPEVKISAIKYNGALAEASIPEYKIQVLENTTKISESEKKENDVFIYAFEESENSEKNEEFTKSFTKEDCKKLAELRSEERNSFPFSKKSDEVKEFENQFGISSTVSEPSKPLFYSLLATIVIFLALTIIFIIFKKKAFILFLFLTCVVIFISVTIFVSLQTKYAIFAGGIVSPVPEEIIFSKDSNTPNDFSQNENAGLRVKIVEETSKWAYIMFNGNGGWVLKENLFVIK